MSSLSSLSSSPPPHVLKNHYTENHKPTFPKKFQFHYILTTWSIHIYATCQILKHKTLSYFNLCCRNVPGKCHIMHKHVNKKLFQFKINLLLYSEQIFFNSKLIILHLTVRYCNSPKIICEQHWFRHDLQLSLFLVQIYAFFF